MNRIKGGTTCLLLAMLGTSGVAAEPAKVTRAEVGTEWVLPLGSLPERICWYQDQKYSLGARIQQGESLAGVWPAKRAGDQWPTGLALAASGDACGQGTVG